MQRSRTGSLARKEVTSRPVATVQVPLPLLDVLTDTRTAFFGLLPRRGAAGAPHDDGRRIASSSAGRGTCRIRRAAPIGAGTRAWRRTIQEMLG